MRPPVTPIFPPNKNGGNVPTNLPIRNTEKRDNVLQAGGYGNYVAEMSPHHHHREPELPSTPPNRWRDKGHPELNCISIAQHIDMCPICSKLYDTDKTLYILAIIGLLILCFLMVKRIVKL
jgi:hypothetical protein